MSVLSRSGSPRSALLVRRLVEEGKRIFTVGEAAVIGKTLGLSRGYFRQALHRLEKSGWLVRLRKGLYAVSHGVPGSAPVHEFEIAMALANPAAISHWSAMHYHGLTEQIPRIVFVTTTSEGTAPRAVKGEIFQAGGSSYQFIRVMPERFFGTERVWVGEARITITDPERTLLDGLSVPEYCGDFAEVLHAIEARGSNLDVDRIVGYAQKLDVATAKRLGWILEKEGVDRSLLEPLASIPIKGYRSLDPSGPRKGKCNRRWMIQENLPGKVDR